jgi:hypothetical protein
VQEFEPNPKWFILHVPASTIYDLGLLKFQASQKIRYVSSNIPVSLSNHAYQVPLITNEDLQYGLDHNHKYVHMGFIQFGLNSLPCFKLLA